MLGGRGHNNAKVHKMEDEAYEAYTQEEWSIITVTPVLMKLLQHTNSMVSNVTISQLIIINPIKRKP